MRPPKTSGVYLLRNLLTKKVYVGQTNSLYRRWISHFNMLCRGVHGNLHLQSSFNKHGVDNFEYEVIEECSVELLDERETFWLNKFHASDRRFGYNIEDRPRGTGPRSAECITRLRKNHSRYWAGKKLTKEHRQSIALAVKGVSLGVSKSSAHKVSLSIAQLKRFSNPRERKARAAAQRKLWNDPDYRARMITAHTGARV